MSIGRSTAPRPFVDTNIVGTLRAARGDAAHLATLDGAGPRLVPVSSRLHRRGLRHARGVRHVQRRHAVRAELALCGEQGVGRSSRARLLPHVRPAGAHHQLLEQLRSVSVSREADPADDPERDRRPVRCRSTATAATCATGSTSRTTVSGSCSSSRPRGWARSTASAAATSAPTSRSSTSSATSLDELRAGGDGPASAQDVRQRPAGPRSPLRDRCHQDPTRARLAPPPYLRVRPARDRALCTGAPQLVCARCSRASRRSRSRLRTGQGLTWRRR